jgi:hypothetical protein
MPCLANKTYLTATSISTLEVPAIANTFYKFLRHGFTSLIMLGKGGKKLWLYGIILHEL